MPGFLFNARCLLPVRFAFMHLQVPIGRLLLLCLFWYVPPDGLNTGDGETHVKVLEQWQACAAMAGFPSHGRCLLEYAFGRQLLLCLCLYVRIASWLATTVLLWAP